ncbi:MAG: ATP-binding protein [Pseudomonadota bacterium]
MDRIDTYNAVIEALRLPALIIGAGKRILSMNQLARDLMAHDGRGAHYTTILRQPGPIDAIESSIRDRAQREAFHMSYAGDLAVRYRLNIAPLGGQHHAATLVVFEDVSGAEGVGQMRRDFVANVSHELRTPLTSLIGFIETLRGPARNDPAAMESFLAMMGAEAERMNRLVEDLLSLSRVEGEARVRPDTPVDVVAVLQETQELMNSASAQRQVELNFEGLTDRVWVAGDPDQLVQVFRNLVENAIKYGASRVDVRATRTSREPTFRGPAVTIDIIDDGDGIEAHHVPRLTERFYRVDSHRSRAQGGTGLGLAIVKHIVGRHRGRFRISSELGVGSTFSVILPIIEKG